MIFMGSAESRLYSPGYAEGRPDENADDIDGGILGVAREITGVANVSLVGILICTRGVDRFGMWLSCILECG